MARQPEARGLTVWSVMQGLIGKLIDEQASPSANRPNGEHQPRPAADADDSP